ncbi:MAG: hypothetical protein HYT76_09715, partial [Deltaproteobacteria bacterium]|nr:hypothetical protein [Deltaproteobacteria bacterium]
MTRRNLRLAIAFLSITGLLLIPSQSLRSQNTSVSGTNLEFFHPSIDPSGYFGVNGPRLMKAGQTYFRISQSFAGNHLFLLGINNTPVDLVDKIFTTTLTASLGINDSMTFSMETPFHLYAREADFNTLAPFTTRSVGDLRMGMKFNLLTETEKAPGVALLFTNSFPTGNESKFLGTSHMVPGLEGIVGKDLALFSLAANIGMRFPQQKNVLGINFDDQITYGSGIKIPFGFFDPMLSVLGEIRGHLEPNQVQIVTAPVEFTTGLQKEFRSGLTANAGVGGAWNNAIGNPRIRGLITISFSPVWKKEGEKIEKALARQREEEIKQEALEQKRREKELAALKREKHKLEKELAYQKEREELKKQDQEAKQLADKIKKEKAELEKLR